MTALLHRVFGRLRARSRAGAGSERGFTLIEVVASVVILGIIAAPLGMAMVIGFRTAFSQQENISRTTDVQQLSSYFPSDVQSVDAQGVNPTDSNNSAICRENPAADQTSLITFVWNEDQGVSGESMARYIAEGSGSSSKIVRRFCRGAADPSQPASSTNDWTDITVASHFGSDSPAQDAAQYTTTTDPNAPDPGKFTPQCTDTSCFIEIHGAYDYRLDANRRVPGQSPNSLPPDAPTNVHGVPGNQRVTLYWTDGAINGSAITSYSIQTNSDTPVTYPTSPANPISGSTGVQINGLTNATSYKFRVKATNSAGSSAFSPYTDVIVPGPTTPDPPTIGTATASPTVNGSADVAWTLPTGYNNGGANLIGFRIYALNSPDAPVTADVNSPTATTGTVTGLKDNTNYTLQVSARNLYGEGSQSAASNAVLTLPGKPGTPNVQSTGTAGSVVLTFSPPSDGDFANFTNFRAQVTGRASAETAVPTATACPTGSTGTCSLTVTGLGTTGQTYSIAVQAQNATGWGTLSDPATGIELTPPTISGAAIMPVGAPGGGYVGPNVSYNVYANATDASGVATVTANVNNVTAGQTAASLSTAGGPWTVSGTSYTYRTTAPLTAGSSLTAGTKSFSITAIDTFANTATSSFNVTGDVTAPTVTLTKVGATTPAFPYSTNAASIVSVGGACGSASSPPDNPVVNITVTGPSSPSGTATCTAGAWTYTFTSPITAEGSYSFTATQSDYAGNVGSSGTKVVNLDRTAPTISASTIATTTDTTVGGFIKSGGSYYVYANVTDGVSGVNTVNANVGNITTGSTNVALTLGSYTVGSTTYNYRSAALTASGITSGTKSYTVTAVDNATNSSGPQSFNVVVDGTPPTISSSIMASSTDTTTGGYVRTNGSYFVYSNVSDATAGVASVTANVGNVTTGTTAAPLTTAGGPWTIGATTYSYRSSSLTVSSTVTAGSKAFTLTATDWAANSFTSAAVNVTVDNTAPAPTVTSVNGVVRAFPYSTNQNVTTVGGACGNAAGDQTPITVTITGASTASGTATCSGTAWTYTLSSVWSAEGSSTITAAQSDAAGGTGTSTAQTVTIDKTVPVVTLTAPANGSVTNDTTPSLSGACTNGQGNVTVTITGPTNTSVSAIPCSSSAWSATSPTLASGTGYNAVATQTDVAGNTGTSATNGFTVDAVAPTVSSIIASSTDTTTGGFVRQGGGYFVYGNASDAITGITSVTANVTNVTTGQSAVSLSTTGGPWTVGATPYAYRSAALTANASLTAGAKSYSVIATDGATNTTTINPTVTVDNTPPAPTVTSVNGTVRTFPYSTNQTVLTVGGACGNAAGDQTPITVTIAGSSTASGTATCSGTAWTYTLSTAWATEGVSTITAAQSDAAGGTGISPTQTVTIDKTAPVVNGSTIAMTTDTTTGGFIKPSGSYYIYANVTDSGTGISSVTANVTNVTTGSTAVTLSSGSFTVGATSYNYRSAAQTASAVTAGVKSYNVTGNDVAGNTSGAVSFNVTVDATGPSVPTSVIAPLSGTTGGFISQGSQYYVYANATDPAGVTTVTANVAVTSNVLTTGATAAPLTTTGGPWTIGGTSYSYRSSAMTAITPITAGSKNYQITATDTATNTTTPTFTVTVKNTAPVPTVTSINGAVRTFPYATNANVTTYGGACGNASGDIATVSVTIAGAKSETGTTACVAGAWTYTLVSAWTTEGVSTFSASQSDLAGNTGLSTTQTVTIDKTAPVVAGSAIATTTDTTVGGFVKQAGSYYIYAQVTDAVGMSSVTANVTNVTTGQSAVALVAGSYTLGATSYNYRSAAQTATTPLTAGAKSYTVTGIDIATNTSGPQTFSVTVDNTAPTVSTAAIAASGSTTAGFVGSSIPYFVYANVTDTGAISSVNASVTNITTGASSVPLVAGSYSVGATTYNYRSALQTSSAGLTAGSKTFTVTAIDVATNTSGATSWNVTVDNTAPTVAITKVNAVSPSFPYSLNSTVTTVGGTCTTAAQDSTTINVTLAGADNESGTATCSSGAWTYTFATPWATDGTSTVNATQADFAGNVGNATARSITIDKTPPQMQSMLMQDTNNNGKVDRVVIAFDETLASYTAGTTPWTLTNVPSGGTLASVSVSGTTATLTINEGAGAANTAVGTFKIALAASATGIRDALGNQSSYAATAPTDNAAPVPTSIVLNNKSGGTAGKLENGDFFTIAYSEPIDVSTLCNTWTTDTSNQGPTSSTASVPSDSTDPITLGTPCQGFGTLTVGTSYGSGAYTMPSSQVSWNVSTKTLTVVLGTPSVSSSTGVAAAVPSYTATTLSDPFGNVMTGSFNGTSSRF